MTAQPCRFGVLFTVLLVAASALADVVSRRMSELGYTVVQNDPKASDVTFKVKCEQYKRWEVWGLVALITPVVALIIMVLKPALPGI